VLYVQGRQHKVTVLYSAEPQPDYLDAALKTIFQIHKTYPPGAVLVFLPGAHAPRRCPDARSLTPCFARRPGRDRVPRVVNPGLPPRHGEDAPQQGLCALLLLSTCTLLHSVLLSHTYTSARPRSSLSLRSTPSSRPPSRPRRSRLRRPTRARSSSRPTSPRPLSRSRASSLSSTAGSQRRSGTMLGRVSRPWPGCRAARFLLAACLEVTALC